MRHPAVRQPGPAGRPRGVSLVEALVALAVLAFGILGVVGVQVSLRLNGDVSRQRAEAVRIAQERIESQRAFTALGATGTGYADIGDVVGDPVFGDSGNTTYTVDQTVTDAQAADPAEPRLRSLVVDVRWTDRAGATQAVRLSTGIAGVAPGLAGSLGVPADRSALRLPGGRNPTLPPGAVDQHDGTSLFTPPGQGATPTTTWVFDNITGLITRICNPECTSQTRLPLSGFVRFAPGLPVPAPPAPAPTLAEQQSALEQQAESPDVVPSAWQGLQVEVSNSILTASGTSAANAAGSCFTGLLPVTGPPYAAVEYYCAVPTTVSTPLRWSGRSTLDVAASPALIATSVSAVSAAEYRVCRYTPQRDPIGTVPQHGDFPTNGNVDHPRDYVNVTAPLTDQNFLVIPAGDGTGEFACPADYLNPSLPFVNSNTWQHQPHT